MVRNHKIISGFELVLLQYAIKLTERSCHMQQVYLDYFTYAGMDDAEILRASKIIFYFNYVKRSLNGLGVTMKAKL